MVPYIRRIGGRIRIKVIHKIIDNTLNIINELRNLFKAFNCFILAIFSVHGHEDKNTDWKGINTLQRKINLPPSLNRLLGKVKPHVLDASVKTI